VETIFQPFRQAEAPGTKKSAEGAGLGLSIAQGIVQAMGGSLELGSTSPQGTTFIVKLTLPRADLTDLPGADGQASDTAALPLLPTDVRILVVEDTTANQVVMDAMLAELGLEARNAFTATEAEETLAHWDPDCILLDLELPDAQGLELAQVWRTRYESSGQSCPVLIAVTAHVTQEHRQASEAAGFDGFLSKPLSLNALGTALSRHFPLDAGTLPTTTEEPSLTKTIPASPKDLKPAALGYPAPLREKLARLYLDQWLDLLRELNQAREAGDCEKVVFCVHRLKGIVANFAPNPAHRILSELDRDDLQLESAATQSGCSRLTRLRAPPRPRRGSGGGRQRRALGGRPCRRARDRSAAVSSR
jgi:CheY-like chemotaxis protein